MFISGEHASRSNPLSFYVQFFTKKNLFRIPSIDKLYPFHVPCLELCISFNCCKCTAFWIGINRKNRTFSQVYKAIKFICKPFWALSETRMTDFPTLSYTSISEIPNLKKIPLSGGASHKGHFREYPLSPRSGAAVCGNWERAPTPFRI